MLDERDLFALSNLIDEKITASEARMTAHMSKEIASSEERMTRRIADSEERMTRRIADSEERMTRRIADSENRTFHKVSVMMESYFEPKFNLLAENQQMILDTMVPKQRIEEIEDELAILRSVVRLHSEQIAELKKA